jgi:hypothetical protein
MQEGDSPKKESGKEAQTADVFFGGGTSSGFDLFDKPSEEHSNSNHPFQNPQPHAAANDLFGANEQATANHLFQNDQSGKADDFLQAISQPPETQYQTEAQHQNWEFNQQAQEQYNYDYSQNNAPYPQTMADYNGNQYDAHNQYQGVPQSSDPNAAVDWYNNNDPNAQQYYSEQYGAPQEQYQTTGYDTTQGQQQYYYSDQAPQAAQNNQSEWYGYEQSQPQYNHGYTEGNSAVNAEAYADTAYDQNYYANTGAYDQTHQYAGYEQHQAVSYDAYNSNVAQYGNESFNQGASYQNSTAGYADPPLTTQELEIPSSQPPPPLATNHTGQNQNTHGVFDSFNNESQGQPQGGTANQFDLPITSQSPTKASPLPQKQEKNAFTLDDVEDSVIPQDETDTTFLPSAPIQNSLPSPHSSVPDANQAIATNHTQDWNVTSQAAVGPQTTSYTHTGEHYPTSQPTTEYAHSFFDNTYNSAPKEDSSNAQSFDPLNSNISPTSYQFSEQHSIHTSQPYYPYSPTSNQASSSNLAPPISSYQPTTVHSKEDSQPSNQMKPFKSADPSKPKPKLFQPSIPKGQGSYQSPYADPFTPASSQPEAPVNSSTSPQYNYDMSGSSTTQTKNIHKDTKQEGFGMYAPSFAPPPYANESASNLDLGQGQEYVPYGTEQGKGSETWTSQDVASQDQTSSQDTNGTFYINHNQDPNYAYDNYQYAGYDSNNRTYTADPAAGPIGNHQNSTDPLQVGSYQNASFSSDFGSGQVKKTLEQKPVEEDPFQKQRIKGHPLITFGFGGRLGTLN